MGSMELDRTEPQPLRYCAYCDADVDERYEDRAGVAVSNADVWFCGDCVEEIVKRWYWRKDGKGQVALAQPQPGPYAVAFDATRRQRELDEDDGA